ncbi:MAG: nucleoside kinase [Oscillospiraceae bacterium]|jgi:uridine kinase|nr:nucleoside kinase [Oscillospiraceae bacterium]
MKTFVDYYIKYTERLREINDAALNSPTELIAQMEQQFRKRVTEIAEFIAGLDYGHKILMVAGPSASGKTTTASILSEQLRMSGIGVLQVSLDDFFLGSDRPGPMLPDGTRDYETVHALDIELMQKCLLELIVQGEALMPDFNFQTTRREAQHRHVTIGKNDVVIVEGIHALNPIVTDCLPDKQMLKMYISVKQDIKDRDRVAIEPRDIRLIRRIVRDFKFRASSAERTFGMWKQVCIGEDKYIAPYKRLANITLNTIHIYEPNIFKPTILKLLSDITESSLHFNHAQDLIQKLGAFEEIDDKLIPKNSLIREFIGDGIYEY